MTFTIKSLASAAFMLSALASPCQALDVLLTNDDGFEASMIHAMYRRLKAAGHRVLISASAMDGTSLSGALPAAPIGPLATASRGGHVPAGSPGVGTLPGDSDVYYVNSTPAVALLHGLDVAAPRAWGKPPDIVVSGVNYGHNTGLLTVFSGTFNAAMTALGRGVPAIAISAGGLTSAYRTYDALAPGANEFETAEIAQRLLDTLVRARGEATTPLLPEGIGLNVNIPDFLPGTGALLRFRHSKIGAAVYMTPMFVENLAADPLTALTLPPRLPGITGHLAGISPQPIKRRVDNDPTSEQNVVNGGFIAVSVVQSTHEADAATAAAVGSKLTPLVAPPAR